VTCEATTLGRIGGLVEDMAGVLLRDLPPSTTLLIKTLNTQYRVVIIDRSEVYIQGGKWFPSPTLVHLNGARLGDSTLRVGWIAVDLRVEILWNGQLILTSPVQAICTAASCTG
jgi:hypothetical protein